MFGQPPRNFGLLALIITIITTTVIIATIIITTIIITTIITLIIINIIPFGTDIDTMSVVMDIMEAACRLLLNWDIDQVVVLEGETSNNFVHRICPAISIVSWARFCLFSDRQTDLLLERPGLPLVRLYRFRLTGLMLCKSASTTCK
jgi:hypothetical protein